MLNNFAMRTEISFTFSNPVVPLNIEIFGKLHGELSNLSEIITDFFALLMLMALMTCFLQVVWNSYNLYLYATSKKIFENREILMNVDFMFWHITVLLELFFIAIVSGTVCDEVIVVLDQNMK